MSPPRLLAPSDIPQAMRLKDAEGWNQTAQDWHRLLELSPEGCFGIEHEGRLIATTTTTSYGRELAWIGMVITAPEFRGRGLASRLLSAALEFLDARATCCVKLDATSLGAGLYRKFGFVDECPVERWLRAPSPAAWQNGPAAAGWDAALDLRAFGADRSALLAMLAQVESACIPGSAFAMGRPGSHAAYFGPCVATDPLAARSLLEGFLARHAGEPVYWDLLPENQAAVHLAVHYGFERSRQLVRMTRGPSPAQRPQEMYAMAGLEFG